VNLVSIQRLFALAMAAGLLAFILHIALQRHQYQVAGIVICLFSAYVAINAWLFVRLRKPGKR
jgi:uncharacterized membrane protein